MTLDRIQAIEIDREMRDSFLEYAMSVIVSRALPDVRDGLKPVHRRILYSMYDAGIRPGTPYRKCARVVGDVMGWFHPHSNDAIYDALVRLGQDFASRYPLVDPQGNFGTVDDPPAAMRYTEARLAALSAAAAFLFAISIWPACSCKPALLSAGVSQPTTKASGKAAIISVLANFIIFS